MLKTLAERPDILREITEKIGLERVIEGIGEERLIRSIGEERFIQSLGEEEVIRSIGEEKLLKDFIERFYQSPGQREDKEDVRRELNRPMRLGLSYELYITYLCL
ncbi:MAG: hypothetical protein AB1797_14100 [bacterium]